ncbi:uncharacterized protein LOC126741075 [Anthonomus grandis grandis]|uniref:uncharacterized protein LOC126741075 n=1 Tax=Anthonomus grandis grandis TaxID=2921223 RepID=UPI0021666963|nr:uncharacterized protein LOC126741075 [Anthonomus grandis grandis]
MPKPPRMDGGDKGEHSRKNDSTDDDEKPLKKARFLWEVKGKHHLKKSQSDLNHNEATGSREEVGEEEEACMGSPDTRSSGTQESPSLSSFNCHRDCCVKSFLAKTEDLMDRYTSDEDHSDKLPLENSIENEIPAALVSAGQHMNQDHYFSEWQARQIARGFVDNTINRMLENLAGHPFEASILINNQESDGQVEDDAILMAIQSHGLQSGGSRDYTSESPNYEAVGLPGSSRAYPEMNDVEYSNFQDSNVDNMENLQKEQEIENSSDSRAYECEVDLNDPMDFLNAAVSVAIQKKGLTYG